MIFSFSFLFLMILMIPFWFSILQIFNKTTIERNLSRFGSLMGLVSFFSGLGIIIYPMDTHFNEHRFFANLFFILLAAAVLFYSLAILFNPNYSNFYVVFSLAFFIIIGLFELVAFGNYQPFVQKIIFYCFFSFTFTNFKLLNLT